MSGVLQGGILVSGLPEPEIAALACDHDGVIWIACGGAILAYADGKLQCFDRTNSDVPDTAVVSIFADRNNVKWFITTRGAFFTHDDRGFQVVRELATRVVPGTITQDLSGRIWISGLGHVT
jgi:ligand-binding sensor domain-containing protein